MKTAEELDISPENCIVFEESTSGVQAAKAAKMKVVALTTTHSKDELKNADIVINDYREIDSKKLSSIM